MLIQVIAPMLRKQAQNKRRLAARNFSNDSRKGNNMFNKIKETIEVLMPNRKIKTNQISVGQVCKNLFVTAYRKFCVVNEVNAKRTAKPALILRLCRFAEAICSRRLSLVLMLMGFICFSFNVARGQDIEYTTTQIFQDYISTAERTFEDTTGFYIIHFEYNTAYCTIPATFPAGAPHYGATITVYKVIDGRKKMIGEPFGGQYIEKGCFEDASEYLKNKAYQVEANMKERGKDVNK